MTESVRYLLPYIGVSLLVSAGCFLLLAVKTWKLWPQPDAWVSRIGRIERRQP